MRINHNIAALNTYRQLTTNTSAGAKSLEKLSSGLRINRAGDDAAGLAISEKMRAQIRGLTQAQRNAQDGISMIQTTEGALNEAHSILQRMRELSAQAANDTNVAVDREEIQKEMIQLTNEVNRIGNTTEFNTQSLLKGKNVAVVESAAALNTLVAGEKGVAVGDISDLTTLSNSVKAAASSASVQASTSAATGAVSEVTENTESIAGVKSSVNLSVGLTVTADEFGTDLNGKEVTVRQGTVAGEASRLEIDGQGNYSFTVGQTAGGDSRASNLGTLYNEMKSAISNYDSTTGFTSTNAISVTEPPSQNTGQAVTLTTAGETAELAGGVTEVNGQYALTIESPFEEAGDSITVGGQTFTAVLSGADASKGQFNIGNIEATLTGGENTAETTDLATVNGTVSITIGGSNFTIANTDLQAHTGGSLTDAHLKTIIEGASNGTAALSTVANVAIGTDGKISITAKNAQTTPITWTNNGTTDADKKLIADAFGMNTTAQLTSSVAISTTEDLDGVAAQWDTGTMTAYAGAIAGAGTFEFNGVTVNITYSNGGGASAVGAVDANNKTVALTIDDNADTTSGQQATQIINALNAYKNDSATSEFDDFTFSANGGTDGIAITGTTAAGDQYNANTITVTGDTLITTAAATVAGVDTFDSDKSVTFTVDGKEFSIDAATIRTTLDGGYTAANVVTMIQNAKDSNGYTLSDFADVSETGGVLTIKSQGLEPTSEVAFSTNSTNTTHVAALEAAFRLTNFQSDSGADSVSSSRSVEDQAKSLAAAIEANSTLGSRFEYASISSGTITLTETNNQAAGVTLGDTSVAGSGSDAKLAVTNAAGQNLNTISITRATDTSAVAASTSVQSNGETLTISSGTAGSQATRANGVKVELNANTSDTLNVSFKDGVLSINMATTPASNSTTAITTAIQNLGTIDGIDFSTYTATSAGAWNANNLASDIEVADATMSGGASAVVENQLNISVDGGDLTIHLSAESVKENTSAKIQSAVQDLGEYFSFNDKGEWTSTDFSKYTFESQGGWDTSTLGNSIIKDADTFVGGTEAVEGQYSIDVTTAFAAGDKVEINGQVFTAVDGVASGSKGEFSVSAGVLNDQTASLMTAINLNSTLNANYTAAVSGTTITLTEKTASGSDLTNDDLDVRATGTAGEFTVAQDELLENGAKFIVDGQEISITSANAHVGFDNGTAVKVADTIAGQTQALADAINDNANLNTKYTASVADDGSLKLTQTEDFTSETAPVVSTKNSSIGDFKATFQIGANSGQSMTITVADMRANAMGIAGDGSVGTVAANNGAVASYTTVANVNSGSDNKSVQFALDVTTSEKASAALSVINDAIEKVSAQRSQLGAFQNRLDHTINNLGTSAENLVASESRIRDVDMAAEMMEFTKNNILSQAAQAMLAQANQQPQGVLQLLR
jgi:flagellin